MLELPEITDVMRERLKRSAPRASRRRWYEIEAAAPGGEAEVKIYGDISWRDVDPDQFVRDLDAVSSSTINVRINSAGGEVFGGVAIYNALVRHPARIVGHVDGVAASIASLILMAADDIRMGEGSLLMIHAPHWVAIGNAAEFRVYADLLDKVQSSMAGVYAARTGRSIAEIMDLMTGSDRWFTADEAVEEGFADTVDSGRKALAAKGDLSMYSNVPDGLKCSGEREKPSTIRETETVLRDAGFSREEAKRIAAHGYKAAPRDEDVPNAEHAAEEDTDRLLAAILNGRVALAAR